MTAADAIAVADLEEAKHLAAEFEAVGGEALTMAIAQEAKPGDHYLSCSKNGAAGGRPRRLATAARRWARRWPVARDRSPA